jgi:two-component system chemotaxis response regulator CheY
MVESAIKVLVVEDLSMMRMLIRHQLGELGILQVVTAADGEEALDLLHHEPDVDLILCDWHMSPMDGLTFCAQVQAVPHLGGRKIPVLFMTGDERLQDPDKRRRALETAKDLGIIDILLKPFTSEDLGRVLAQCPGLAPTAAG